MKNLNRSKKLLEKIKKYECPNITYIEENFPFVMHSAKGLKVKDVDGNFYYDFTSCFGVQALGHKSKVVTSSLRKQMSKLIHGMGDIFPSESKIRLLELLSNITGFESAKTILGLNGGDAVEAAMKTAILVTSKDKFLYFSGAYHGLQFGPLAVNGREYFRKGFEKWLYEKSSELPFPLNSKLESLPNEVLKKYNLAHESHVLDLLEKKLKTGDYAALILEPIQGRAGEREFSKDFLTHCQYLTKKYRSLLIFDEIYTGFGRTGSLFASQDLGLWPDILCLGKALGGGLPLSACLGDIVGEWETSRGEARHTSTFLGHPLSCEVAYRTIKAIIKLLKEPLFQKRKDCFFSALQRAQETLNEKYGPSLLMGKGFMLGLWFYTQPQGFAFELSKKLLTQGFLTLPSGLDGTTLSLTPPLVTDDKEISLFTKAILKL